MEGWKVSSGIPSQRNRHMGYDCLEAWAEAYVSVCVSVCVSIKKILVWGVLGDGMQGEQAFREV